MVADFALSKQEFIALGPCWDAGGCYAIFHESPDVRFRASDLGEAARYKTLASVGWNLELAIPDGSAGEWGQIASPDCAVINRIEAKLRALDHREFRRKDG